ncbi:glycosyltransferase family 4 protein [Paraburkholderia sediminicola]|uniref:glycosyltransferase family 4 protein n=1 Tax=Paraburkholderia sediminicola TaxID=458836 RepID=UPI0038BB51C5
MLNYIRSRWAPRMTDASVASLATVACELETRSGQTLETRTPPSRNLTRPVRLVVFLEQDSLAGGGYQQAKNAALLVKKLPASLCNVVFVTTRESSVEDLRRSGIEAVYFPMRRWRRLATSLRVKLTHMAPFSVLNNPTKLNAIDRFLGTLKADLVYFTNPSQLALLTEHFNYLFTVWDLSHRDEVEFPEVRIRREFERREILYQSALKKASGIFVDSVAGKDNVVRRYCIDSDRVHVVPFSPAVGILLSDDEYAQGYIDIKAKYQLTSDYVYYPAQFWPHKNHVYLLRGLRSLEDKFGIRLGAVFSGRDFGNKTYVHSIAADLGLDDRVVFTGFVPDDEIPYLYRQAVALVMPTYFGPTNLPPLEAFKLGVPVLYSDLTALRDQVGDAGVLLDLNDPGSMADGLHEIMTQPEFRMQLIERGRQRIEALGDAGRLATLHEAIERFQARKMCWGSSIWTG